LLIHETAHGNGDLGNADRRARHFGTTQIEVAVLQTQFLIHLLAIYRVVHGNGKTSACSTFKDDCARHFDFAGRNFRIVPCLADDDGQAADADHAFAAQTSGALEQFFDKMDGSKTVVCGPRDRGYQ